MRQPESIIPSRLGFIDLGLISYPEAYEYQKEISDGIFNGTLQDTVILCEHPHTITIGRTSDPKNILLETSQRHALGVELFNSDRGGDVTYHGPGQLIIYPVFNLKNHGKNLRLFLRKLEQVVIDFFKEFEIISERIDGYTGVWIGNKKIASIGIAVRHWISSHGIAINLNTDLSYFSLIKPCGLDVQMTSLKAILGRDIGISLSKRIILSKIADIFFNKEVHFND